MMAETEQRIAYYTFKSQRMRSFFPENRYGGDDLQFLLFQLNRMQNLLTPLQKPWGRYIPMAHASFLARCDNPNYSLDLLSVMVNMMQCGNILDTTIKINSKEIVELKELIRVRDLFSSDDLTR